MLRPVAFACRITAIISGDSHGMTTFEYDRFGRRIQISGPLNTTNYLYSGPSLVEEIDPSGNILSRYVMGGLDAPLSEQSSSATSYYETDGLGSATSLSNSSGAIANTYGYDSFGRLVASTGNLENPFQYTSREFDPETGLYYYRARYYSPSGGRLLSEDPLGFNIDPDFYSYVGNSPTGLVDPSGKTPAAGAAPVLAPIVAGGGGISGTEIATGSAAGPVGALITLDVGLAVYDYYQAKALCAAMGWCGSPSAGAAPGGSSGSSPASANPGGCSKDPCNPNNFDKYANSASQPFKGGPISNAGSGLQSHSGRGQGFPTVKGPPSAWNNAAQEIVEDILTNPASNCRTGYSSRQGNYVEIQMPNGIGARWSLDGNWIGFIGP